LYPHLNKPIALDYANTKYVTWLDSDCIYVGNIDSKLIPKNGDLQIRFRGMAENDDVFRNRMSTLDSQGVIPEEILKTWRNDVNENVIPRYKTQCVTNSFCINRDDSELLSHWTEQIEKVSSEASKPVNTNSFAYFMSDESVMSSLLCFRNKVPKISPYCLNDISETHLMHFGMRLKPWSMWRDEHLQYYHYIQAIIQWTEKMGYEHPNVPMSLNPDFFLCSLLLAKLNKFLLLCKTKTKLAIFDIKRFLSRVSFCKKMLESAKTKINLHIKQ